MRWFGVLVLFSCASTGVVEKGLGRAEPGVTDAAGAPRRFALLVGIDQFDDPHFRSLRFAADDARDFGAALTGYHRVKILSAHEDTLKATILAELDAIGREATNPRDTVLVYVSSHGTLGRRPGGPLERFVVTRDTQLDVLSDTGLAVERLRSLLEKIPARKKALILALCHSGKGKSVLDDSLTAQLSATKSASVPLHEVSEGLLVLTACAFGETARESEALGHDIYTSGLLKALELGDRDGDGAVTALEAHDFARDATFSLTSGEQRPTAEVELVGRDPVVLAGEVVRTSAPVLFSYSPAAEGLRLRVDGVVKGTLPGGVSVGAGQRALSIEDAHSGQVLARSTVTLAPGERLDVSDALPPAPSWALGIAQRSLLILDEPVRLSAVPWAFGGQLQLRRTFGTLSLTAGLGYLTGTGNLPGIDETLPFRTHLVEPSLALRWRPLPQRRFGLSLEAAWWVAIRDVSSAVFRSTQVIGAPSLALGLSGGLPITKSLSFDAGLRGGLALIGLEHQLRATPYIGLDVTLDWNVQ